MPCPVRAETTGNRRAEIAAVDLLHGDCGGLLDPNRYALAP
jgi:hypothetical protein